MNDTTPAKGDNLTFEQKAFGELEERAADLIETADKWIKERPEILEAHEGKANEFIAQLRAHAKACDNERKERKEPHLEANKAIEGRFKPLAEKLKIAMEAVQKPLAVYLDKKSAKLAEEKREKEETARKAEEAARLQREKASTASATVSDQYEADQAEKRAEEAGKTAKRAETKPRAKGAGTARATSLRTYYRFRLEDISQVPNSYTVTTLSADRMAEAMKSDAIRARIDAGEQPIPGVHCYTEKQAV